ncbi:MAG: D-glycero-beta-D-manno-heptose-7-phosphate kinase [Deltaproteobacteria bacterium]|jgi:rfaE bifunctional protein kinase chain/domain
MMQEIAALDYANGLAGYMDKFPEACILVVGDIIMDEYIWGDVSRISPEAPVPVVDVRDQTKMLGGAANVLNNIVSLGGRATLCGVIGDDPTGWEILERLKATGAITSGVVMESKRPTSIKTRIIAHNQQVVRFDRESRKSIQDESRNKLLRVVEDHRGEIGAVVVADYGKGVISRGLMEGLQELLKDTGVPLTVDPKIGNFDCYHGVDVITPNHHEAGAFSRVEIVDEESLVRAGRQMMEELACGTVLVTQGKEGMTLFEKNGEISHIPTVAKKVFDVTGAGDTVVSTFCLGLALGMDMKSAAVISNFAAGIVVAEVGTTTVRVEELRKVILNRFK